MYEHILEDVDGLVEEAVNRSIGKQVLGYIPISILENLIVYIQGMEITTDHGDNDAGVREIIIYDLVTKANNQLFSYFLETATYNDFMKFEPENKEEFVSKIQTFFDNENAENPFILTGIIELTLFQIAGGFKNTDQNNIGRAGTMNLGEDIPPVPIYQLAHGAASLHTSIIMGYKSKESGEFVISKIKFDYDWS